MTVTSLVYMIIILQGQAVSIVSVTPDVFPEACELAKMQINSSFRSVYCIPMRPEEKKQ